MTPRPEQPNDYAIPHWWSVNADQEYHEEVRVDEQEAGMGQKVGAAS